MAQWLQFLGDDVSPEELHAMSLRAALAPFPKPYPMQSSLPSPAVVQRPGNLAPSVVDEVRPELLHSQELLDLETISWARPLWPKRPGYYQAKPE